MYGTDRLQMRHYYFDAWKKFQQQQPLTTLEQQIAGVIADHPEYHLLFNQPEKYLDKDYLPEFGETNPYMHLGLHLSLRDQISTDKPAGIQKVFEKLCQTQVDSLAVEHVMLDALAEELWRSMQAGKEFDVEHYLDRLQALI